jgi:hypothetical protein
MWGIRSFARAGQKKRIGLHTTGRHPPGGFCPPSEDQIMEGGPAGHEEGLHVLSEDGKLVKI